MPVVLWKKSGKLWQGQPGPAGTVWRGELKSGVSPTSCHKFWLISLQNWAISWYLGRTFWNIKYCGGYIRKYKAGLIVILNVLECFHMAVMVLPQSYCKHRCHINVQASGGENAGFRTEVSIKHGVCAERATSTLIGRHSETQQALQ